MNKEEKNQFIDQLALTLGESPIVYLADTSELNADDTSKLRRSCHKQGITLQVVKNTLLKRAMDKDEGTVIDYEKQGINQIFVYKNPNATGSCGCGESFTTN